MDAAILVIENDEYLSDGIGIVLELEGYRVQMVKDWPSALAMLQQSDLPALGLIISEFHLPEMDADTLFAALNGNPRLSAIPVILLMSVHDKHKAVRFLGAAECLLKPFDADDFLLIVRKQLRAPEE